MVWCAVAGVAVIAAPLPAIASVWFDQAQRTKWDEMYWHGHEVEKVDRFTDISYFALKGMMGVTARDLVSIGKSPHSITSC